MSFDTVSISTKINLIKYFCFIIFVRLSKDFDRNNKINFEIIFTPYFN